MPTITFLIEVEVQDDFIPENEKLNQILSDLEENLMSRGNDFELYHSEWFEND